MARVSGLVDQWAARHWIEADFLSYSLRAWSQVGKACCAVTGRSDYEDSMGCAEKRAYSNLLDDRRKDANHVMPPVADKDGRHLV